MEVTTGLGEDLQTFHAEFGIRLKPFSVRGSFGDEFNEKRHAQARAGDDRLAAEDSRVDVIRSFIALLFWQS